jgi:hypothetical protein
MRWFPLPCAEHGRVSLPGHAAITRMNQAAVCVTDPEIVPLSLGRSRIQSVCMPMSAPVFATVAGAGDHVVSGQHRKALALVRPQPHRDVRDQQDSVPCRVGDAHQLPLDGEVSYPARPAVEAPEDPAAAIPQPDFARRSRRDRRDGTTHEPFSLRIRLGLGCCHGESHDRENHAGTDNIAVRLFLQTNERQLKVRDFRHQRARRVQSSGLDIRS